MPDFRRQLWLNIMEDLGPPEGCIGPGYLICGYVILFPLHGLGTLLNKMSGFDLRRMAWTIHGQTFSDRMLMELACVKNGRSYRIEVADGILCLRVDPIASARLKAELEGRADG